MRRPPQGARDVLAVFLLVVAIAGYVQPDMLLAAVALALAGLLLIMPRSRGTSRAGPD
jgi:membrane-bound ClpP family serine protease